MCGCVSTANAIDHEMEFNKKQVINLSFIFQRAVCIDPITLTIFFIISQPDSMQGLDEHRFLTKQLKTFFPNDSRFIQN